MFEVIPGFPPERILLSEGSIPITLCKMMHTNNGENIKIKTSFLFEETFWNAKLMMVVKIIKLKNVNLNIGIFIL